MQLLWWPKHDEFTYVLSVVKIYQDSYCRINECATYTIVKIFPNQANRAYNIFEIREFNTIQFMNINNFETQHLTLFQT
jgi:hypothetical protein